MNPDIWTIDPRTTDSETESVASLPEALDESEIQAQRSSLLSIEDHIKYNIQNFNTFLKGSQYKDIANSPINSEGELRRVITSHGGSKIPSNILNPVFYRNSVAVTSIAQLAALLDAPPGWEEEIHNMKQSSSVQNTMASLMRRSSEAPESFICPAFSTLFANCSMSLMQNNTICQNEPVKYGVGGVLAKGNYAVVGISDYVYCDESGLNRFVTEIKTETSFRSNDLWYRQSHGSLTLHAMYFTALPVLLANQRSFKLIFESSVRDCVYCFPSQGENGNYAGPIDMEGEFLDVVGLLILSPRSLRAPSVLPTTPRRVSAKSRPNVLSTAEKIPAKKRPHMGSQDRRGKRAGSGQIMQLPEDEETCVVGSESDEETEELWFLTEQEIDEALKPVPTPWASETLSPAMEEEALQEEVSRAVAK